MIIKIVFAINAVLSLILGIKIWVTGESATLFSQVCNEFLLAGFFTLFAFATYSKPGKKG